MPFPGEVRLPLGPSRLIAAVVIASHALAAVSLLLIPVAVPLGWGAVILIGLSLIRRLRQDAWRVSQGACLSVDVHGEGRIRLVFGDGSRAVGKMLPGSYASPWLVILRYRPEGKWGWRHCVVPRDATVGEAHRVLRVLLRHPL